MDGSELTLIERTGENVKTDNILSGTETLKESSFIATRTSQDLDTPDSKDDEYLNEKNYATQSSLDDLDDFERSHNDEKTIQPDDKQNENKDSIEEMTNDEARSDDTLEDLSTSRKMLQEDVSTIPGKDISIINERSGLIYDENAAKTNRYPGIESTSVEYSSSGFCCEYVTVINE